MSLVVWWVAPPSEWVERTTRRPCAKSCGGSSGPSTVVLAAAHDRLPELAYFVTTAGPMFIAFVFWLFYFLLAPLLLKKTAKASLSESSDAMFLVWDSCVHKLDQVSRASFSYEFLGQRTWVVCHGLKSVSNSCEACNRVARLPSSTHRYSLQPNRTDTVLVVRKSSPLPRYIGRKVPNLTVANAEWASHSAYTNCLFAYCAPFFCETNISSNYNRFILWPVRRG